MRSAESLLAPMLTPTMPPACARAASRRSTTCAPSLLKPMRLMTARPVQPEHARARIARLWPRRHRADLDEAEPSRSIASGTSAFLSKPAAMPIGLGKFRPKARTASFGSSGRWPYRRQSRSPVIAMRCASSGSNQRKERQREVVEGADHGASSGIRESVRSRAHVQHRRDMASSQLAIEMRKQLAAARGFPA